MGGDYKGTHDATTELHLLECHSKDYTRGPALQSKNTYGGP